MSHVAFESDERSQQLIRGFRALLDEYPGERMIIGEVYILDTARFASYVASDQLNLAFNFPPISAPWTADAWRQQMDATYHEFGVVDAWPSWVLSNHDQPRHRTRYGSEARARAAAVMLLNRFCMLARSSDCRMRSYLGIEQLTRAAETVSVRLYRGMLRRPMAGPLSHGFPGLPTPTTRTSPPSGVMGHRSCTYTDVSSKLGAAPRLYSEATGNGSSLLRERLPTSERPEQAGTRS